MWCHTCPVIWFAFVTRLFTVVGSFPVHSLVWGFAVATGTFTWRAPCSHATQVLITLPLTSPIGSSRFPPSPAAMPVEVFSAPLQSRKVFVAIVLVVCSRLPFITRFPLSCRFCVAPDSAFSCQFFTGLFAPWIIGARSCSVTVFLYCPAPLRNLQWPNFVKLRFTWSCIRFWSPLAFDLHSFLLLGPACLVNIETVRHPGFSVKFVYKVSCFFTNANNLSSLSNVSVIAFFPNTPGSIPFFCSVIFDLSFFS